ncbi:hypothetical protein ACHAXA_005862 [Cyclostephanos tholiformis]|uniref:t-SNARE coiled-coil homology domain-containing protein n=1 Tax=Cyclostephanos tholiformis TaxID=382380 RepID=A0ABD3RES8_9STRA
MSFRDLTPLNSQHGVAEFGGANNGGRQHTPQQKMRKNSLKRAASGSCNKSRPIMAERLDTIEFCRSKSESDYHVVQSLMVQQREEEYAVRVMQLREEELQDIHRKMHVVNEIYKELGEVVGQQQEHIDEIENKFRGAAEHTRRGLEQIENANKKHERRNDDKTNGLEEDGDTTDKKEQFFLFRYLSKTVSEISKLLSICGGSGSIDFVDDGCVGRSRSSLGGVGLNGGCCRP